MLNCLHLADDFSLFSSGRHRMTWSHVAALLRASEADLVAGMPAAWSSSSSGLGEDRYGPGRCLRCGHLRTSWLCLHCFVGVGRLRNFGSFLARFRIVVLPSLHHLRPRCVE